MLFKITPSQSSIPKGSLVSDIPFIIIDSNEQSTKDKEFKLTETSSFKTDKLGSILGNKTVNIEVVTNLILYPIHSLDVSDPNLLNAQGSIFIDKYEINDEGILESISLSGKFDDLSGMTVKEVNKLVMKDNVDVQVDLMSAKEYELLVLENK